MVSLLKKLVNLILSPLIALIDFPAIPTGVAEYVQTFIGYLDQGMGFISYFLPMALVKALLSAVIACEIGMFGYKVILWILNKVPGIDVD